jgi:hypothetical protein
VRIGPDQGLSARAVFFCWLEPKRISIDLFCIFKNYSYMKTFKIALSFGLPWSVSMLIFKAFTGELLTWGICVLTLAAGIIAGLLFALSMKLLVKRLHNTINVHVEDDEQILKEAGANHFKGLEGVGGKLVLTDKRLIFKSHKYNVQNHQDTYGLDQIDTVLKTKTLNIISNGLTIGLRDQRRERFVIDRPEEWVKCIERQKSLYLN